MSNLALYQVAQEFRQMVELLMQTQDDAAAIKDTIEAESYPLEIKARNVAYAARNLEALAEQIKAAEKEMYDRRKAVEKRAERIRDYLKECMEVAGVHKIDCPQFCISIKNNPESVEIYEQGLLPPIFMKQAEPPPPSPDKTAIKAAIKGGEEVPGARLIRGTRIEVK